MMLDVQNVTKRYGRVVILDDVSLSLKKAETMALVGESGSGKSTLLHLIAGLDAPDAGQVMLDGDDLTQLSDSGRAAARRDRIGLVFQQFNLVQSLTVAQNVALQARLAGRHDPERDARLLARLGLEGLDARYPEQLSGGQQQRVAIARALAAAPPLLLADEPTGNLDEAAGDRVMDLLLELVSEAGMALILVTHSARLAQRLGRVETLAGGHLV
ncbi:ABC transporter ATP-binding protein [Halovulum sp. GXIMD14794]